MVTFENRVAIVTGAGAGLGRAYAHVLAAHGCKVVVNDVGGSKAGGGASTAPADTVVAEIRDKGGEAIANHDSIADPDGVARLVRTATDAYGRVDALINNAGILREGKLGDMSLDDLQQVIQVHLMGTLYCTRAVLPLMLAQRYGRIVLTGSGSGLLGHVDQSVYGAAKAAMLGLMACLRFDCAETGVLINTVVPSAATRMSAGLLDKTLEPFMGPEMVAPLVAYLASEACTCTGEAVNAYGGHYAKVALVKAQGLQLDPTKPLTPGMVADAAGQIFDMAGAEPYRGTFVSLAAGLRSIGKLDAA